MSQVIGFRNSLLFKAVLISDMSNIMLIGSYSFITKKTLKIYELYEIFIQNL